MILWWSGNLKLPSSTRTGPDLPTFGGGTPIRSKVLLPSSPCVPVGWAFTLFWVTWSPMWVFLCQGRSSIARKSSGGWNSTYWRTSCLVAAICLSDRPSKNQFVTLSLRSSDHLSRLSILEPSDHLSGLVDLDLSLTMSASDRS